VNSLPLNKTFNYTSLRTTSARSPIPTIRHSAPHLPVRQYQQYVTPHHICPFANTISRNIRTNISSRMTHTFELTQWTKPRIVPAKYLTPQNSSVQADSSPATHVPICPALRRLVSACAACHAHFPFLRYATRHVSVTAISLAPQPTLPQPPLLFTPRPDTHSAFVTTL
jgi:hypothetical protein